MRICAAVSMLRVVLPALCASAQAPHGTLIGSSPPTNAMAASTNVPPVHAASGGMTEGYRSVGFDTLANFDAKAVLQPGGPEAPGTFVERLAGTIPESIQALDGKKVAVRGFMMPMKIQGSRVSEFLLLKNQSLCCFGIPPRINEWIYVRMGGKTVPRLMDQTITVFGALHVGEYREQRRLRAIYLMDGDKMEGPDGSE